MRIARERAEAGVEVPRYPEHLTTPVGVDAAYHFYVMRAAEELARLHAFRLRYPRACRHDTYAELAAEFRAHAEGEHG